jgi:hypothetical protein
MREKIPFPLFKSFPIAKDTRFLTFGSCFSENIGLLLKKDKFDVLTNPFGILYHPQPIAELFLKIINNSNFEEKDLIYSDGLWKCWLSHGSLAATDKGELLAHLNEQKSTSSERLQEKNAVLILTFGSAYYYELIAEKKVVANCHKQPGYLFQKKFSNLEQKTNAWKEIVHRLIRINPDIKIILSVSPVRHIADGLINNSRSKALLITLCQLLEYQFPHHCYYFPSYEIVMDCLRDYSYYNEDRIHPSDMAIKEIYQHFISQTIDDEGRTFVAQLNTLQQMLSHRPLHPKSESYQKYLQKIKEQLQYMEQKYPQEDWSYEQDCLKEKQNAQFK